MALMTPAVYPLPAFDAKIGAKITFTVVGGDQVAGNRLIITDAQNGREVYNNFVSSFKLEHDIPANKLNNGGVYNATITTSNFDGQTSLPSTPILFRCYTTPTFFITNIRDTQQLNSSSYVFNGSYAQIEKEELNSFQFNLYDNAQKLIKTTGLRYDTENINFEVLGMLNNTSYFVELIGTTLYGTELTTGLYKFYVTYVQAPSFSIVELSNNCEGGYIQVNSNIVAIDGEAQPAPPTFINNSEIDLKGLPVEYQEVEYIESQGKVALSIPYKYKNTTNIEAKFNTLENFSGTQQIFGSDKFSTTINTSGVLSVTYGTETKNVDLASISSETVIKSKANMFNINGIQDMPFTTQTFSSARDFAIFSLNTASLSNLGNVKLYYLRISEGNKTIHSLTPCYRKIDNKVGLFDKITRVFYTPTSGVLLKGADVDDYFVKWDTGYSIANNFTLKLWGRDYNINTEILRMATSSDGIGTPMTITVRLCQNTTPNGDTRYGTENKLMQAVLKATTNEVVYTTTSNLLTATPKDKIFFFIRRHNNLYDFKIEKLP